MTGKLNRFVASSPPSATFRMMDRVTARESEGREVIDVSSGESDFETPEHVRAAAVAAINAGPTRYTQVAGMRALREAVAAKFRRENGIETEWQRTIVGCGGKQVIFNALSVTLNENDEVIIPQPAWVSYPGMVQLCGGRPVGIACAEETGFKLQAAQLERAISDKTRWLILNSPANPTGAVYSRDELSALARVLLRHPQVLVLSDDIYEHLVYDEGRFHTIAAVEPRLSDRALTMNGVSKSYAMTGWRLGYGTGPQWLIGAMGKLQGQQTSGACTISQFAALAALTGPQDFIEVSRRILHGRRDRMVARLNAIPGLSCKPPAGAFYIFTSCRSLIGRRTREGTLLGTDEDVAGALLDEQGVATVHGSAFGLAGYLRIGFSYVDATIDRALEGIAAFCAGVT